MIDNIERISCPHAPEVFPTKERISFAPGGGGVGLVSPPGAKLLQLTTAICS